MKNSMANLKDGTEVEDPRLDRLEQFDVRSRGYSIGELRESRPLRSYTWRCNENFDQGRDGACVGFSLGHELAARPAEVTGIYNQWLKENIY